MFLLWVLLVEMYHVPVLISLLVKPFVACLLLLSTIPAFFPLMTLNRS